MISKPFSGVITALPTPFKDNKVEYSDLANLVDQQIGAGVSGLVAVGTTGESPTLSTKEHIEVIRATVEAAGDRVPVLAGTGANSLDEALELTKAAEKAGADAMLQVAPYYNKPSQEGLFRHFSAIAEATEKPIVLYSIPGRCGIEISVETVVRLREKYPHVNTIKEAGGSCDKVAQLIEALGDDMVVLSGDDALTLPFMSLGAAGVISVASSVVAEEMVQMVNRAGVNDFHGAIEINKKLFRFFRDVFVEPNPVPIKYALHCCGAISSPEVRLPLCEMGEGSRKVIDESLKRIGRGR